MAVWDLPPVDAPTVKKINFGSASQFGPRGRWPFPVLSERNRL